MKRKFNNTMPKGASAGCTLAELAGFIDKELGRETGIEAAVRAYRAGRDEAAKWSGGGEARRIIAAQLDVFIRMRSNVAANRQRFVVHTTGGGRRVGIRAPVVKKLNPGLYEDSQLIGQARVEAKFAYSAPPVVSLPPMQMAAEAWRVWELAKSREAAGKKAAEHARLQIVGPIEEMAELGIWDGAPKVTTDGWGLGLLYVPRFNEERCRYLIEQRGLALDDYEDFIDIPKRRVYELVDPAEESGELDGD